MVEVKFRRKPRLNLLKRALNINVIIYYKTFMCHLVLFYWFKMCYIRVVNVLARYFEVFVRFIQMEESNFKKGSIIWRHLIARDKNVVAGKSQFL